MITCCSKRVTSYRKTYPLSWEEGLRCKICLRIRIPTGRTLDRSYMNSLDAIREEGMKFDQALSN